MNKEEYKLELRNGVFVSARENWFRSDTASFSYDVDMITVHYNKTFNKYKFSYPKGTIADFPFKDLKIKKYIIAKITCKIKRKKL